MASHYDCIGIDLDDKDEFKKLLLEIPKQCAPFYTPLGGYLPWKFGNGIELWGQFNHQNQLCGINPHFSGKSSQTIALTKTYPRDNPPFNGSMEGWINPDIQINNGSRQIKGEFQIFFDLPNYDWQHSLALPAVIRAKLTVFARKIEFPDKEEKPEKDTENIDPQKIKVVLNSEHFFPIGTFNVLEGGAPTADALFGGTVLDCEIITNKMTNLQFYNLTVKIFGLVIDVIVPPGSIPQFPEPGQTIRGSGWVSGTIEEIMETFEPHHSINKDRLILQTWIEETTQDENISGVTKSLTFGEPLKLTREPGKLHDKKAIAVYTANDQKLGYLPLPRKEKRNLAKIMDSEDQPVALLINKTFRPKPQVEIRVYCPEK